MNASFASPTETSPGQLHDNRTARERGLSFRVVAICIALAFVLGYIVPIIDFKLLNTFLGGTHLPPGAIGALLILVLLVNPFVRTLSKRLAFTRNEALTVYISCLFSSLVPGHGAENLIVPVLIAPFYYATRENKWLEFLQPAMKPWMTPSIDPATGAVNQTVVAGWYEGLRPGASIPWGAWLVPLAVWSAAILAIYIMLACLSVMLRAQWAENEALSFPCSNCHCRWWRTWTNPTNTDYSATSFAIRISHCSRHHIFADQRSFVFAMVLLFVHEAPLCAGRWARNYFEERLFHHARATSAGRFFSPST